MEVSSNPIFTLVGFVLLIIVLFFLIAKWRWHVFLALLVPIILFGIIPGVQQVNFIEAFEEGFGKTLGKIGVVIVLGSVIAEALRHTGAIKTITQSIIAMVGSKNIPLALTFTGFVLGIAIFSDVAYVILNPLVHASAIATKTGIATMSTGLVGSLQLTHAIVPPTPGPLAAAALVGADIGKTIVYGSICCLFGSMACWAWGRWVAGPRIKTLPNPEFTTEVNTELPPMASMIASYAPIVVPIILISLHSVAKLYLNEGNVAYPIITYLGWPVCALTIGVWLAYRNVHSIDDKKDSKTKWIEVALKGSAMILVVTGLGGSLSEILKGTPVVNYMVDFFVYYKLPPIILPFLIGVIGNMITGSTTVGVITAASIVAPMLPSLGLTPEAAMLSGASGSVIIKYVNSSYFWVCTSLSRFSVNEGMLAYGGATLVGGITTFLAVCLLWGLGFV